MRRPSLWLCASFALIALATAQEGCAGTPPCQRNSDCRRGYCLDGECRENCKDTKLDCPKGYVCNDLAQCEQLGGGGASSSAAATGGSGGTGAMGSADASSASASTATTAAQSSSGSGGGMVGKELDLCSGAGGCDASLSCQPMTVGGTQRCTRSCTSNAQCMSGTRCIDKGGKHCLGDDVGRFCTAPSSCNYGCLTGPKYCTAPCNNGSDCPAGYGCQPVGNPAVNVCVKAEAYCDAGNKADCIVPAACDLSKTLVIGGCTLACNSSADCPQRAAPLSKWSCDGLCRRPSDVYGSLPGGTHVEYHCDANKNPVALCNDAQHIDFDKFVVPNPPSVDCNSNMTTGGVSGDSCVSSCRHQGGCPYGFACVALGSFANERIGLCLPVGSGEPGQPCTKLSDCAFGYCTSKNVCSRDCSADGVCPMGTSCVAGGGPNVEGKAFKRCE